MRIHIPGVPLIITSEEYVWDFFELFIAYDQDLQNVIDINYVPKNIDEIELLHKQKDFLYSVFINTLKTDFGRKYVREHKHNRDAQTVYKKVVQHYLNSTLT